jgi:para-aminobenzoate synthetase
MKSYRLSVEKITQWYDPETVFASLYGDKQQVVWLDSSLINDDVSRFSYMGEASSVIRYSLNDTEDIFSLLEKQLKSITVQNVRVPFDFVGGYIGYFGYEIKKLCGFENTHTSSCPDSLWYFIDTFLVFDHKEKELYLACLTKDRVYAERWMKDMKILLNKAVNRQKSSRGAIIDSPVTMDYNQKQYITAIEHCKQYLYAGESYEICLTNRLRTVIDEEPLNVYRRLRKCNPAPYAAYMRDSDFSILCSSPERFLKIDKERYVESKPIKGTRKRSIDDAEDKQLAHQLQHNEKEQAENAMIVDLVRNDLGKVCELGSVHVKKLMAIETYQTVHQMVSTIQGKLKENVTALDCVKACFPGGSMTGAPKKRTIEILDTLEQHARGVYSGSLGFLSANGTIDLAIVIRTMIIEKGSVSLGVGGAILYESDPQQEYEEILLKSKALIATLRQLSSSVA